MFPRILAGIHLLSWATLILTAHYAAPTGVLHTIALGTVLTTLLSGFLLAMLVLTAPKDQLV